MKFEEEYPNEPLKKLIEDLLDQSFKHFGIILVDSRRNTWQIPRRLSCSQIFFYMRLNVSEKSNTYLPSN